MAVSVVPWPVIRMIGQARFGGVQFPDQLKSPQAGQPHVGDDDIQGTLAGAGQAGVAARLNEHLVAFFGQQPAQADDDARVIFDQQDFGRTTHRAKQYSKNDRS